MDSKDLDKRETNQKQSQVSKGTCICKRMTKVLQRI